MYCNTCIAQLTNFNTQRNWAINKREVGFGGGINQFLGDLGGIRNTGPIHKAPSTGWNAEMHYRFRFHPYYATQSTLHFGELRGNDLHHTDAYRHSRNLNFRSYYVQLSQRFDIILLAREQTGRFRMAGLRRPRHWQFCLFAGVGIMYFNPQTKYNNQWIDLYPLKTEGQGLPDGPSPYSRITATIPMGLSFRYKVGKLWRISAELAYTSTFSDYIDDAGGVYYDQSKLAAAYGETSAQLSNPATQNTGWFTAGTSRGKDKQDSFVSFSLTFSKNMTYHLSKRKLRELKSKANYE